MLLLKLILTSFATVYRNAYQYYIFPTKYICRILKYMFHGFLMNECSNNAIKSNACRDTYIVSSWVYSVVEFHTCIDLPSFVPKINFTIHKTNKSFIILFIVFT